LAVPGLKNRVEAAYLLADAAHTPLKTEAVASGGLTIDLPGQAPDKVSSTIVLKFTVIGYLVIPSSFTARSRW
jgi:hypothetical protein